MNVISINLFILFNFRIFDCKDKILNNTISVTYSIDTLNNNLFKIEIQLKNNDSVNYFIPLIKPAYKYCKFNDERLDDWEHSGLLTGLYLTNKILTRADLMETAEIDSMFYDDRYDTIYYYIKLFFNII